MKRSFIAETIKSKIRDQSRTGIASFYCSKTSKGSCTSVSNIVGSILKTLIFLCLARNDPRCAKTLKSRLKETTLTLSSLLKLLRWISDSFDEIYVLVDAVDECVDRDVFYDFLTSIKTELGKVKIIISSRPEMEPGIADELLKEPILVLDRIVPADIETHLKFVIEKSRAFARFSQALKQEIFDKLNTFNGGMYLASAPSVLTTCKVSLGSTAFGSTQKVETGGSVA
jgi:hypothetical protein